MCDEISSSRCLVPSVWKSSTDWATFPWMFQENFVCMKTHMNSWAEVWIAWLQALASNMWSTSAQKWRPGLCCRRGMLSLCKFAWVIWFLSPVSFEPTLIHLWTALLVQSKPLLWFEANAARTGQYGCSFFAEPTIWSCSREGKKGFPRALLLSAFTSLPPSLPPSSILWHTTGEFSLNHMSFYSDWLFCVFLSLVVFCWAIVDVLHCWYESKYGFVCHTIVAMFPWLQDCSWFCCWVGLQGSSRRKPEEDPIFLSDSHKRNTRHSHS